MSASASVSSTPFYLCCVRPYQSSDQFSVRDLLYSGHMSSLPTALISALTRELLWEGIVVVLALLFVFFHLPGHICLMIVPGIVSAIVFAIWTSHRLRAMASQSDASSIETTYCKSQRTGFWVAEVYESLKGGSSAEASASMLASLAESSLNTEKYDGTPAPRRSSRQKNSFQLVFVSEAELQQYGSRLRASGTQRPRVIGACGLRHDRRSPADAAWLSSLAVSAEYRRHGVGTALVSTACRHALAPGGFRCVGAQTSECQTGARAMLNRRGFVSDGYEARPVFIGVDVNVFLFTKELKATKTTKAQV